MRVIPIYTSGHLVGFNCDGERHFHRWRVTAWACGLWRAITERRAA